MQTVSSSRVPANVWKPYKRRGPSFLDVELKASAKHTAFSSYDFTSTNEPRKYTVEEKRWMQQFESVDTFEPRTRLYKDHLASREAEPRSFIWMYVFLIGLLCGLSNILLVSLLHLFFAFKMKALEYGLQGFTSGDQASAEYMVGEDPRLVGISNHNNGGGYLMWVLFSTGCALVASIVAYLVPESIGVGTPEVTAYLNGIENTDLVKPKVLAAKLFTLVLTIGSGLPVGHLGTLIQSGTMFASLILSKELPNCIRHANVVNVFRNPRDKRVMTVIGAAAGVAAAFTVSIGGLAFIVEQLSTVFPVRFAVYVFVSCLVTTLTIQTYFSFFAYFSVRGRSELRFGELLSDVLIQFDTKLAGVTPVSMNLFDFVPTIMIGFLCGLLCALFIRLNWVSLRLRRHMNARSGRVRYLEPIIMSFLYTTLTYWLTVGFGSEQVNSKATNACRLVPDSFLINRNVSVVSYYGLNAFMCQPYSHNSTAAVQQVYHPFGSLAMGFADSTAQLLLSWRTPSAFPASTLAIFFVLYFLFSAVTTGVSLSGDVLLPLLICGATLGRLVGQLTHTMFGKMDQSSMWADPGAFAVIGAASFLGGATGLTFSICIIVTEITNDFRHVLCVMLAISIAKKVCEAFAHSIGISYLEAKCVPMLDFAQQVEKYDMFCAKHIMATPAVTLRSVDTICNILQTVSPTSHHGFPVVSAVDGVFHGLVHRKQLMLVLWNVYLHNSLDPITYDELKDLEDGGYLDNADELIPPFSDEMMDWRLDLSPYIDVGAYCVHESTAMSRTYIMFRTLGLRHLVVITRDNKVSGIITRKDLLADNIMERIMKENRRREQVLQSRQHINDAHSSASISVGDTLQQHPHHRSETWKIGLPRAKKVEWFVVDDDEEEERLERERAQTRNHSEYMSMDFGMHPQSTNNISAQPLSMARKRKDQADTESSGQERSHRTPPVLRAKELPQREPEEESTVSERSRSNVQKDSSKIKSILEYTRDIEESSTDDD